MRNISNNKREELELKIYKALGVEKFRKLVFILEKIIHRKDKGKNTNYHIKDKQYGSAQDFKKYLYYNGAIHVKNAMFLAAVIALKIIVFKTNLIFDMFLLLNLTKDIYCVLLQRYNYIRINKSIRIQEQRKSKIIERRILKVEKTIAEKSLNLSLTEEEKAKDLEMSNNLRSYLSNLSNVIIDEDSIENLKRIKRFLEIYDQSIGKNLSIDDRMEGRGGKSI